MDGQLKLLILERPARARDRRLGGGIDRIKTLNELTSLGAKIRHDSGGRLLVVDTTSVDEATLQERLSGARLVPIDADVRDSIQALDESESLFLDALKIRTSPEYRAAKERQKPGESPEEKALFTAPCSPEA
jgi:hypothetical protein